MMDGGLRQLFRSHLKEAMWQSIETGGTGRGIPDTEYCFAGGRSGWIEFKQTEGWTIGLRPEQIGWIERRARYGGRVFIAVRRKKLQLWILDHRIARINTLKEIDPYNNDLVLLFASTNRGPEQWPWDKVRKVLCR